MDDMPVLPAYLTSIFTRNVLPLAPCDRRATSSPFAGPCANRKIRQAHRLAQAPPRAPDSRRAGEAKRYPPPHRWRATAPGPQSPAATPARAACATSPATPSRADAGGGNSGSAPYVPASSAGERGRAARQDNRPFAVRNRGIPWVTLLFLNPLAGGKRFHRQERPQTAAGPVQARFEGA